MKYIFGGGDLGKVHNFNRGDSCFANELAGSSVAEHG